MVEYKFIHDIHLELFLEKVLKSIVKIFFRTRDTRPYNRNTMTVLDIWPCNRNTMTVLDIWPLTEIQ